MLIHDTDHRIIADGLDLAIVEEKGIRQGFLRGLAGYYSSFPQVLESKYGIDTLTLDVSALDIRTGKGREEFLDRVSTFFAA